MSSAGTRRVERLITAARHKSHNNRYSATQGIDDPEVIELLNDGLEAVFTEIARVNSDLFLSSEYLSLVSGTSLYTLPTRIMHGGRFESIAYSVNGLWTQDTYHHEITGPIPEAERSYYSGHPTRYGFLDGQIFFSPVPSTSTANAIKFVYRQEPVRLDIRRGVVHSDTALSGGGISVLKADTAGTPVPNVVDSSGALIDDYVNLVSPTGAFYMRNIPVTAYNSTTGAFTVRSGFTYATGETAPAGAYITTGHNATTHNPYDKTIDSFLIDFAALYMLQADLDSASYVNQEAKVKRKLQQIVDNFSSLGLTEDYIFIPGQFG